MSTPGRLILAALIVLMSGCKVKEKTAERMEETLRASDSRTELDVMLTEMEKRRAAMEVLTLHCWNDSMAEKVYERIVTDSTGKVLRHELERSRENYSGRGKSVGSMNARQTAACGERSLKKGLAASDSIYNGGTLKEVVVAKKRPATSWPCYAVTVILLVVAIRMMYRR